ncbi:MAG TPA: HAMP domain-containing sensor histidine kinase [Pirellulales bacterium]|nr:HAMP domain-containing sensor histidine kinase [Pirellulales bacterium]
MLWLPARVAGDWRLPLADESAPALLSAIAGGDETHTTASVREALAHDPALALWATRSAVAERSDGLRSIDALAGWLIENAGRIVRWPEGASETPDDEAWCGRYRRLRSLSLAVAREARRLADQPALAEQAFLGGLLGAADQWKSLDPSYDGGHETAHDPSAPFAERMQDAAAIAIDRDVAALVARARQSLDETAVLAEYERFAGGRPGPTQLAEVARCLPVLSAQLGRSSAADFDKRLETAKLAALGEFAAGAGHEINNPIAVIAGRAQLLLREESDPQRRHELAVINSQAMRVYEMIADLMLFARPPLPAFSPCDVGTVVRQVADELRPKADERQVTLRLELPADEIVVEADRTQLSLVVRALCENALAAVDQGGTISIRAAQDRTEGECEPPGIVVEVTDDGLGIADEARQHLFDPFYSGRQAGRGLGMGLSKAWRIVKNHGGRIDAHSQSGRGATFVVVLPSQR